MLVAMVTSIAQYLRQRGLGMRHHVRAIVRRYCHFTMLVW